MRVILVQHAVLLLSYVHNLSYNMVQYFYCFVYHHLSIKAAPQNTLLAT